MKPNDVEEWSKNNHRLAKKSFDKWLDEQHGQSPEREKERK